MLRRQKNYKLNFTDKPSIAENFTDCKLEAELGTPTHIQMVVNSFPEPEVSWIVSAGGKLGYWTVKNNGDRSYLIKTTILPKEDIHIGEYKIRIRNEVGSTDVIIHLVCMSLHYLMKIDNPS